MSADKINRTVYFIQVAKKEIQSDSLYYFFIEDNMQFSYQRSVTKNPIRDRIKNQIKQGNTGDSLFVGVDDVYLDDIKKNDPHKFSILSDCF